MSVDIGKDEKVDTWKDRLLQGKMDGLTKVRMDGLKTRSDTRPIDATGVGLALY